MKKLYLLKETGETFFFHYRKMERLPWAKKCNYKRGLSRCHQVEKEHTLDNPQLVLTVQGKIF